MSSNGSSTTRRASNLEDSDSIDIDSVEDCKPIKMTPPTSVASQHNNNNKLKFSISSLLDSKPSTKLSKEELPSDDEEEDVEDDMKSFSSRSGSPYSVVSGKGSEGIADQKLSSNGQSVIHSVYPSATELGSGGPAIYPANLAYPWLPAAAAAAAATPFLKDGLPSSKFYNFFSNCPQRERDAKNDYLSGWAEFPVWHCYTL